MYSLTVAVWILGIAYGASAEFPRKSGLRALVNTDKEVSKSY